ncbi:MAG: hypothetical protein COV66_04690 [Nitrospinae bacterium CG11_big_fil_rev_8_21_14_0_20_45_15]|nr:MAG: hypothetical protein COV66_04690 [Nitrospinae bacterium CG11_big_fil_rev_8_21_14_0_20_45_15]
MNNEVLLPEKDYLSILSVIEKFYRCTSRKELKETFHSCISSIFKAQGGLYRWTDPDIQCPQVIDSFGIGESDLRMFQDFIPYDPLARKILETGRPVIAYDVDVSREEGNEAVDRFFSENLQYHREDPSILSAGVVHGLVALDLPNPTLGVAVHWYPPHDDQICTLREVRILELLRPHLLQTIKTILLTEELTQYKSLLKETVGKSLTPTAMIGVQGKIIFCTESFRHQICLKQGQSIPDDLYSLLNRIISQYDPPYKIDNVEPGMFFYTTALGSFRLELVRLQLKNQEDTLTLLLKLKPTTEPLSKLNLAMQEAGLTSRETELVFLIKEGFSEKEIAARLFVSPHTVNTHMKNIYRKFGIHSRAELIAALYKGQAS